MLCRSSLMNQVTVVDFLLRLLLLLLLLLFSWLCLLADGLRNQELQTSRLMLRNIFHPEGPIVATMVEFMVPYSHRQF